MLLQTDSQINLNVPSEEKWEAKYKNNLGYWDMRWNITVSYPNIVIQNLLFKIKTINDENEKVWLSLKFSYVNKSYIMAY